MNPDNLGKARSLLNEEMRALDERSLDYRLLKVADRVIASVAWTPEECLDIIWVASHDLEQVRREMGDDLVIDHLNKKIKKMEKNNELDEYRHRRN